MKADLRKIQFIGLWLEYSTCCNVSIEHSTGWNAPVQLPPLKAWFSTIFKKCYYFIQENIIKLTRHPNPYASSIVGDEYPSISFKMFAPKSNWVCGKETIICNIFSIVCLFIFLAVQFGGTLLSSLFGGCAHSFPKLFSSWMGMHAPPRPPSPPPPSPHPPAMTMAEHDVTGIALHLCTACGGCVSGYIIVARWLS